MSDIIDVYDPDNGKEGVANATSEMTEAKTYCFNL